MTNGTVDTVYKLSTCISVFSAQSYKNVSSEACGKIGKRKRKMIV